MKFWYGGRQLGKGGTECKQEGNKGTHGFSEQNSGRSQKVIATTVTLQPGLTSTVVFRALKHRFLFTLTDCAKQSNMEKSVRRCAKLLQILQESLPIPVPS